jgi:uncharacterized membrane protein
VKRPEDLRRPRYRRRVPIGYDAAAFGKFSERIARFLGTARFLVVQSVMVVIWISLNVFVIALRWDPYPFILLNLMFSVQAAYAAPLILLAQNRQEDRDRHQAEIDRTVARRTQEDAEYLARELAAVRLALADSASSSELRDMMNRLEESVEQLRNAVERLPR